jgi:pimeloyl-ACP methyl ester carboxylesterase
MWDGQVRAFAEHHRTVRWDMRGFGRSPMVAAPYSDREDLAGLMGFLALDSACLVGCSKGAETVIDFALDHPRMVDAMVLVGSAVGGFRFEAPEPPQWAEMAAAYRAGDMARAAELETEIWVVGAGRSPDDVDASVLSFVREMDQLALATEETRNEHGVPLDPPAIQRLGEIEAPTLVVVGDADAPDILAASELLTREIDGARNVVMQGTAHLPNLERPDEFNRVVLQFLAEITSPGGPRGPAPG